MAPSRGRSSAALPATAISSAPAVPLPRMSNSRPISCAARFFIRTHGFSKATYKFETRVFGQSEDWYRYNVFETGIRPQISKQITKQLDAAVFLQGKEVSIVDEGIILPRLEQPDTSSAHGRLTYPGYPLPGQAEPAPGFIGDVIGEVASSALGSTVISARHRPRHLLFPVTSRTLLALGARAGWMQSLSGNSGQHPHRRALLQWREHKRPQLP